MTEESHPLRGAGNFSAVVTASPAEPSEESVRGSSAAYQDRHRKPGTAGSACAFETKVDAVRLEIGFGGGEHLHHETGRYPQTGFIGVEPFVNGMAKMLAALDEEPRPNLRLYDEDATAVLDWLPDASLSGIDLFIPIRGTSDVTGNAVSSAMPISTASPAC